MKPLLLWGAGGHAKVVLDVVLSNDKTREVVFVDSKATEFCGYSVRRPSDVPELVQAGVASFVVCIGDNLARAARYADALAAGLEAETFIHPSAVISPSAVVGPGSVVMPHATVNAGARIGSNCIINTGSIVEHDCVLADHVHLSPAATLGGGAALDAFSHVGLNATLLPLTRVGMHSIVGAGAVVLADVPPKTVVAGVPARTLRSAWGGRDK